MRLEIRETELEVVTHKIQTFMELSCASRPALAQAVMHSDNNVERKKRGKVCVVGGAYEILIIKLP